MKNVSTIKRTIFYSASGLLSICLFTTFILTTLPDSPEPRQQEDLNLDSFNFGQTVFAATSPFPTSISNVEMPTMVGMPNSAQPILPPNSPVVPQMPNHESTELRVVGLLPPSVAILQKNGKTITVKQGSETPWGLVSSVSKNGVTIGGEWIAFKK